MDGKLTTKMICNPQESCFVWGSFFVRCSTCNALWPNRFKQYYLCCFMCVQPIDGSVYIDNEYFKAGPILQVELCCMLCFCVNMCASLCMGA